MPITAAEVRKIAKLARLRLGDEETVLQQGQFARILELMAELSALDAGAPAAAAGLPSVMRDDSPAPFPGPQRLLALAPEREGDYYKVKKVIA